MTPIVLWYAFQVINNVHMNGLMTKFHVFQGWFSPGQVFVLDEYCARYGVRGCYRHLCYLADLLDTAHAGTQTIDPTLIHYSFAFCASHVHGNRCIFFLKNKLKQNLIGFDL